MGHLVLTGSNAEHVRRHAHEAKSTSRQFAELVRPHWKALSFALAAVLGETVSDLLEHWPLKIVVDNLLHSKPLPAWLAGIVEWWPATISSRC